MGACNSSPYSRRARYRDPDDFDECYIDEDALPLNRNKIINREDQADENHHIRSFGQFRSNSVHVPDDIVGLPSTQMNDDNNFVSDVNTLLYSAEIDNGKAWRSCRPGSFMWFYISVVWNCGFDQMTKLMNCDEVCCWVKKEYSKRVFYRVYPNRIEINDVNIRLPWGLCGCGSWNSDWAN